MTRGAATGSANDPESSRALSRFSVFHELRPEPGAALDDLAPATADLIRLPAGAAFRGGPLDELLGGGNHSLLEEIPILSPEVRRRLPAAVPGAVPVEVAAGGLQTGKEIRDLRPAAEQVLRRRRPSSQQQQDENRIAAMRPGAAVSAPFPSRPSQYLAALPVNIGSQRSCHFFITSSSQSRIRALEIRTAPPGSAPPPPLPS